MLGGVDVQDSRGEVVDVRSLEPGDIGDQGMCLFQLEVSRLVHQGVLVPSERLQTILDELVRVRLLQSTLFLGFSDKRSNRWVKDVAFVEYLERFCAQSLVHDELGTQ